VGGDHAVRLPALRSAIGFVISGIVLAAGSGRRFGGTKQLVPYRGRPLVQHAIDALASAGVDEIVVVTGHDADRVEGAVLLPPQARFVRNPDHRSGQASSLAAGLHHLGDESEGAVILLADQPGVTDAEVRSLMDAFEGTRSRIVRIAYADGPGPALLSREVFADAGHLHGDVGARALMASHPDWVEEVAVPFRAPADIDRPEDLDA
jgi:CTP:molybdopterin cytidylyltransferase MocA